MSSYLYNWNYPTPVRFGPGTIAELPDACAELGIRRPLLITDAGLADLPITRNAASLVPGTRVYAGVRGNPVGADVDGGIAALLQGDHDGVIAFGGGSALDVAKTVALAARQGRPIWDLEDVGDNWKRVDVDQLLPVVAVPTTSGTGSEVGRCSVIVNVDQGRKVVLFHARMLPERVICDPALTLGLPAGLTAGVGMDAFAHNLEAYLAPGFHPMADGIAIEGIRLVHRSLRTAVADGANLDARCEMMAASLMGATSFQKGLGAIHSLSHPIGVAYDAHHGTCNAVVMPYVLHFNRSATEDRIVRLARYLDLPDPTFEGFVAWTIELRAELGIPHTTAGLGMVEVDIAKFAPYAASDPTAATNPIPLDEDNLAGLYRQCLHGELPA
ncbi:MAG: iron-containing alcohol dehydrogenase [Proteobacteria bacterium]|nr:iron-containing alcohol dehydrogenase [Pseudomonadota bacterium]